ncbi:hypothetical protein Nepgr_010542 [Nepenthes gracilis]|uniref:Uncharacterized protein n=1 Tax=Nepenthes gracilis TaxID=150966 RepID=A0AAD3SDM3_NEPGR|nr:hypothetical protein Nepgr_010542 [Nepenthes gracilis]
MDFFDSDAQSLWSHIKFREEELLRKRLSLMGFSESSSSGEKLLESDDAINQSLLPESVLREDDVIYDTVKRHVERGFRACKREAGLPVNWEDMEVFDQCDISRTILALLDDLTNNGLYLLAKLITGGSVLIETTRWEMKKSVKAHLPNISGNQKCGAVEVEILHQLSQLLNDPKNFRLNNATVLNPTMQSHHAAVLNVLDGLIELPSETLHAMHRKLRGIQGCVPRLKASKSGWKKKSLVKRVSISCLNMLSKLGKWDELQEPLIKAMAIAGLSSKLTTGDQNLSPANFRLFTPQVEALQNEILKALWSLDKVETTTLQNLKLILDPETEVHDKGLKTAIKKMLTEFLFECSDMDVIPDSLLDALALINQNSHSKPHVVFSKELIEEEVECIFSVSSQMKQILWDYLPAYEFDQDFADAYMEKVEESDDEDFFDDDEQLSDMHGMQIYFKDVTEEEGSSGDLFQADFNSQASLNSENGSPLHLTPPESLNSEPAGKLESQHDTSMDPDDLASTTTFRVTRTNGCRAPQHPENNAGMDSVKQPDVCNSDLLCGKTKIMSDIQNASRNRYTAVQQVCDETSLVAYQLIGLVLEEFTWMEDLDLNTDDEIYLRGDDSTPQNSKGMGMKENQRSSNKDVGDSIIVRAVQDLIPSFCNSELEKVRKMMGSQSQRLLPNPNESCSSDSLLLNYLWWFSFSVRSMLWNCRNNLCGEILWVELGKIGRPDDLDEMEGKLTFSLFLLESNFQN